MDIPSPCPRWVESERLVLASVALTSALDELTPAYEKTTGDKLTIGYSLAADLKKRAPT
jgi:hypothetical protein